jgi:hypothetical protein
MGKSFSLNNTFYCLQCGNRGIPLARKESSRKEKFHRKKLFCIHCREEVNHIECRNEPEIEEFIENFKEGVYIDEAKASISFVRSGGMR